MKAVLLSARWAGRSRRFGLEQVAKAAGDGAEVHAENVVLRDTVEFLVERLACAQRRLKAANIRTPYSPAERLHILWCVEYFGIPRRRIPEYLGVARPTVWRWLRRLQDGIGLCGRRCQASVDRTAEQLERLVWAIRDLNPQRGRHRIAMALWALGVFLAPSTVRDILLRARPQEPLPAAQSARKRRRGPVRITATSPNQTWSVDKTRVWRWGIWPTWVLVAVDHFSRMATSVSPLYGSDGGWVIEAMESAFRRHGPPEELVSDRDPVFTSEAFQELLRRWGVRQRFGMLGRHGSVAVTERAILTLKGEWLRRVAMIRGADHLEQLLGEFAVYYNEYRGHMTLGGAMPDMIHRRLHWERPHRSAKTLPPSVERRQFAEARVTAFRAAA